MFQVASKFGAMHDANLMISDATSVCVAAVKLSTFFNNSYKKIKIWKEHMQTKPGNKKRLKLESIRQTSGQIEIELFENCLAATQISHQKFI